LIDLILVGLIREGRQAHAALEPIGMTPGNQPVFF
jgi:hypothetical protein